MRLVTRSDFDGLACGALLKEAGLIDSYLFTHPKDIQDGVVGVSKNDILANVPYVPGCGLWFDHHVSEGERLGAISYRGLSRLAPSCARVIYDYLGGTSRFDSRWDPMMEAVDKVDSANLTAAEITNPGEWVLIGYIMDPRTGLGRVRGFRISNYQLMAEMIDFCRTMTAAEMLEHPDIKERVDCYMRQNALFKDMLLKCSHQAGEVVIIDFRDLETIYPGNRFLVYTLFPDCKVSIHLIWGKNRQNVSIAMGNSIINRTSRANLGKIALKFGGGGHEAVATCQVMPEEVGPTLEAIINQIHEENHAS